MEKNIRYLYTRILDQFINSYKHTYQKFSKETSGCWKNNNILYIINLQHAVPCEIIHPNDYFSFSFTLTANVSILTLIIFLCWILYFLAKHLGLALTCFRWSHYQDQAKLKALARRDGREKTKKKRENLGRHQQQSSSSSKSSMLRWPVGSHFRERPC